MQKGDLGKIIYLLRATHILIGMNWNYCVTDEPKGINASLAILKHCNPKGMPIIVMQNKPPIRADSIASGRPDIKSQMRFRRKEPKPPPYTTSFPKGKKARLANLKHCMPIGIPTIVIHHRQPASTQLMPITNPPNRNHIRLPRQPIILYLALLLIDWKHIGEHTYLSTIDISYQNP